MIREIKALFLKNNTLGIDEISNHFNVAENVIEPILSILIQKKIIEIVSATCTSCSGGCSACPFANHKNIYKLIQK